MRQIEEELISKAKEVSGNAYAPYSNFQVGAAIHTTEGQVFAGCNVENASYGLTSCAERNAIFQAVSRLGQDIKIDKVAIFTPTEEITPPCGACLQVMSEFAEDLRVMISNNKGEVRNYRLEELMPQPFSLK